MRDASEAPNAPIARSAMKKAMWRILPLILAAYVMAYIDRVNISFASLQMNEDLHFSATIYGLGGGLFFLGYALFEVPSSMMLSRFTAPQWIARIMMTWGLLSAGMMFVRTPLQFYTVRFLLGVAEAGFLPSLIYYFSQWFPMAWRGRAVSRIYVAPSIAGIVMGGISSGLLALDGASGLRGWQWLFLVQGLPAVLVGLIVLRFLPATPASVDWLDPREKAWIHEELARDATWIGGPRRHNLFAAFRNPMVLFLGLTGFLLNGSGNGLALSAPAVLAATAGLQAREIGNIVSAGGFLGILCILFAGWNSDRSRDRFGNAAAFSVALTLGILLLGTASTPVLAISGYLLFAATWFAVGVVLATSWADVLPPGEVAVGSAAINTLWQIGSFLSPYAWGLARDATGNFRAGLLGDAALAAAGALLTVYIRIHVRSKRRHLSEASILASSTSHP